MTGLPDDEWRKLLELAELARDARRRASLGEDAAEPLDAFRREHEQGRADLAHPLGRRVYAPLIARMAAGPLTIAQVGQSLDGRIATESGHSHYINGEGGLDHLHRLRALADAVVVGATTVVLDDPRLTTRRVAGPEPGSRHHRSERPRAAWASRLRCRRADPVAAGVAPRDTVD